jgi:hypothetical protein
MVDKKHFDKADEFLEAVNRNAEENPQPMITHDFKFKPQYQGKWVEQKTSIPSDQEMLDNISEAASKIKSGSRRRTVQGDELFTQPGLSGVMPGWDKYVVSEKETAIGESQPCVLGGWEDKYVKALTNIDLESIGIDAGNPCVGIDLTEEPEKENTLDADDLAKAHTIEDHIEDWLTENYDSKRHMYTITLPIPATLRVFEFIQKRMYNWTITPETSTRWILR